MNTQDWSPLGWSGWISLPSKGLSRVFSNSSKTSVLPCSAFFIVQLSHLYMTTGKAIALTRWTFVGRVMSLLFNMLSQFSSVQSLSHVRLFATPWTAARQASLSITSSWSLLKLMSIDSVMPSNHLILCRPLLPPSIFPRIRGFWVSSSHQVAKLLELRLQHQSFQWIFRTDFL